jgi:RNA polymerase sigma factor (sigma-70 family)
MTATRSRQQDPLPRPNELPATVTSESPCSPPINPPTNLISSEGEDTDRGGDPAGSGGTPDPGTDTDTGNVEIASDAEPSVSPEATRRGEIVALLHRVQAGDRAALAEIVDRLMPLVWNVARAGGTDRNLAEDVVQHVWLLFLGHLHEIHTPAALPAWLVMVTRREAVRMHRIRQRQYPVEQEVFAERPDPAMDVGAYVAQHDVHRCLWRNLQRLDPRCQELLRIIAFTDRPNYARISQELGMPPGSIGPTRGRCLAKLRRLLADDPTWNPQ